MPLFFCNISFFALNFIIVFESFIVTKVKKPCYPLLLLLQRDVTNVHLTLVQLLNQ